MPRPSRPTHIHWQRGIPVVTVAIDNGTNAGLQFGSSELVFRTWDGKWRRKYYCRKGRKLELVGWESYQVKRLDVPCRCSHDHVIAANGFDTRLTDGFVDWAGLYIVCELADPVRHPANTF